MNVRIVLFWIVIVIFGLSGCSENDSKDDTETEENGGGESDSDNDSGSESSGNDDSESSGDASGITVNAGDQCPHVLLGNQVPVTYAGNTEGLPNCAESSRLEWKDAPDDTLLFIAPEDGDYLITMTSNAEFDGISPSIQENETLRYYTEADCPAAGETADLDGFFTLGNPEYPETFSAGQHVLIWVSSCDWEPTQYGPYTITIEKAEAAGTD